MSTTSLQIFAFTLTGIMDMMKNMYDEGDENMKKIIGEAMLKSRNGEKMSSPSLPTMGDDAF